MQNFPILSLGTTLPAGTSSARVAIPPVTAGTGGLSEDLLIYNPDASNIAYVIAGDSAVVATTACMPILPGEKGVYRIAGATHVAAIRSAGTTALIIFAGRGQ